MLFIVCSVVDWSIPGKASIDDSAYGKGMVLLGRQGFFLLALFSFHRATSGWCGGGRTHLNPAESRGSVYLLLGSLRRRRQNQRHLVSLSVPPPGRSHWGTGVALWASSIWTSLPGSSVMLKAGRGIWRASPALQWTIAELVRQLELLIKWPCSPQPFQLFTHKIFFKKHLWN